MEVTVLDQAWDAQWDALVGAHPHSGFMQSSAWQRFREAEGFESLRVGILVDGELLGGCTYFRYPSDRLGGVVHAPEGPVLPWGRPKQAREALKLLQTEARRFGADTGAVAFRIEPRLPREPNRLLRNWRRSPVDATPLETWVIRVRQPDEILLADMHPKARYNVRLAERRGVTVRASRELDDLRIFFEVFQTTAVRQKFFSEPYGYFLNLADNLFPTRTAEVLIAEYEGECAAAMLLIHFGDRSTFFYGGSNPRLKQHMPNHAMQWHAMRRAREYGSTEYDLFGCDPYGSPNHPYYGFSRFKRQLGGGPRRHLGAMDLIFYDELAERMVSELATAS